MTMTAIKASDVQLEHAILGSILIDPRGLDLVDDILDPEDMLNPRSRDALGSIRRGIDEGIAAASLLDWVARDLADSKTPFEILQAELLGWLLQVAATSTIRHDAHTLATQARLRRMVYESRRVTLAAAARDLETAEEAITALADLSAGPRSGQVVTLSEAAQEHATALREIYEGKRRRYRTGLQIFDQDINAARDGCISGGQLGLIGGRTSAGKTTLCTYVALQIAHLQPDTRIRIFSLELHPRDLASKAIAREIFRADIEGGKGWERAQRAADNIAAGLGRRIEISDELEPKAIIASATRAARDGVNVFVVDHIHRIRVPDPRVMRHALGDFAKRMRDHAKRFNVPWLVACQLNRESTHNARSPGLHDIAESDIIAQEADWCVNIWYPDPMDRRVCELRAVKNRTGPEAARRTAANWTAQSFHTPEVSR
tara:strand:+ start:382 stop:1674 length:1293 start_codon:yes stop_codon:yes gene_type:complete